ncbi:MAG: TIR domain-containing protein, partial [Chloroflexota bacterium]
MIKIFISYRRADSRKDAGRIYDRLIQAFGKDNIFKDVDDIKFGDFRGILREAVAKCDVELVIIGKQWLNIKDADGNRRLDNAGDFVRIEVESGLQRDKCLVVPVVVDNATMPSSSDLPDSLKQLSFQNRYVVRDDPDFHNDVGKLIRDLKEHYNVADEKSSAKGRSKENKFDVYDVIRAYYVARKERDWETSREILADIREHEIPDGLFDVDAQEQYIWREIEKEEAEKRYQVVRLAYQYETTEQTWKVLQALWQDFPDYDPDGIGDEVRPEQLEAKTHAWIDSFEYQDDEYYEDDEDYIDYDDLDSNSSTDLETSAKKIRNIIGEPFEWCEVPAGEFLFGTM